MPRARSASVARCVECKPPSRLVYTWEWRSEAGDESKHSGVEIDIEQRIDGLVRLTVSHVDLERDPQMLAGISGDWPWVLSNLKTLLETERVLPRVVAAKLTTVRKWRIEGE